MPPELCLIDSNILIRWVKRDSADYAVVGNAVKRIVDSGLVLCYTSQNLGQFCNVLTRPADRNGYGFRPEQAEQRAEDVETAFRLLPDSPAVHTVWRQLLTAHRISGVQVHDARLVASMLVHQVPRILTYNTRDFQRFGMITAIHPLQLI